MLSSSLSFEIWRNEKTIQSIHKACQIQLQMPCIQQKATKSQRLILVPIGLKKNPFPFYTKERPNRWRTVKAVQKMTVNSTKHFHILVHHQFHDVHMIQSSHRKTFMVKIDVEETRFCDVLLQ